MIVAADHGVYNLFVTARDKRAFIDLDLRIQRQVFRKVTVRAFPTYLFYIVTVNFFQQTGNTSLFTGARRTIE